MEYEIHVKFIGQWWFRRYRVIGNTFKTDSRSFVLFFKDGTQLVLPHDQIVIRMTKSWFEVSKRLMSQQVGQPVQVNPRSPVQP